MILQVLSKSLELLLLLEHSSHVLSVTEFLGYRNSILSMWHVLSYKLKLLVFCLVRHLPLKASISFPLIERLK